MKNSLDLATIELILQHTVQWDFMRKKKSAKKFLIVLIVVGVAALGYFLFVQGPVSNNEELSPSPAVTPTPTPKQVDWQSLIPAIQLELGPEFSDVKVEERGSLSIYQSVDITGDNVSEALVDIGSGGAYTEYLTLMLVKNGQPAVAEFKQEDGKISPLLFLVGASAMNGEDVEMLPEKNAIYSGHWSGTVQGNSFGNLTDCGVEAYQWNDSVKIFEFNAGLSEEIRPDFCRRAEQQ